ncbi:MAG: hypothetical protein CMK92_02540, partial [Pseudomonas sp.]|nr:hypothetical protein [Pseudomonas sp.]
MREWAYQDGWYYLNRDIFTHTSGLIVAGATGWTPEPYAYSYDMKNTLAMNHDRTTRRFMNTDDVRQWNQEDRHFIRSVIDAADDDDNVLILTHHTTTTKLTN